MCEEASREQKARSAMTTNHRQNLQSSRFPAINGSLIVLLSTEPERRTRRGDAVIRTAREDGALPAFRSSELQNPHPQGPDQTSRYWGRPKRRQFSPYHLEEVVQCGDVAYQEIAENHVHPSTWKRGKRSVLRCTIKNWAPDHHPSPCVSCPDEPRPQAGDLGITNFLPRLDQCGSLSGIFACWG